MGQAKARKEEINKLKLNPRKLKLKLIALGAFYKNDQEDGFAVCIESGKFGQAGLDAIATSVTECATEEAKMFNSGNWAYFDDATTKEEAVKNITDQLVTAMRIFNTENKINRKVKTSSNEILPTSNQEMIVTMSNIQLLEVVGELKSDNFNGMVYQNEITFK